MVATRDGVEMLCDFSVRVTNALVGSLSREARDGTRVRKLNDPTQPPWEILIGAGLKHTDGHLTVLTDPAPVTAHLGTSVHLNCLFEVGEPQVELSYLAVQWFFNGQKVAEFNDKLLIYSPGVAISEQGLKDGNASLVLTDVHIAHEGDYVCGILYTPDKEERTVTLKVEAPPRLSVPDPLVTENEASELICNIDDYYPELISVWWLRDGVLQHDSQRNTTRKNEDGTFNTTSTYTLTPTDKDKNIWYACRVDHTALMEPLQTKFTLEFKPEPSKVNIFLILFILALVALVILAVWVILWRKGFKWESRTVCNSVANSSRKVHAASESEYVSEFSVPQKCILGQTFPVTCRLGGLVLSEIRAVWMMKKPDGCAESDETVPEGEGSKTPLLEMAKVSTMSSVDDKKVSGPMMIFTSTVNYDPRLEDDGAEFSCKFLANEKEILTKNTPRIHILAKPEISNIKQLPVPEKSSVKFQLDISNFYPQKITIQWYRHGTLIPNDQGELCTNRDGTFCVSSMITIPNSNLEAGDRIQVRVEHDSTESPVTKEVTFSKDEKLGK
nr:PREDICTED: uncharacterized protein LOC106706464 [Latimeria chalumnae]|eukprot:XP_014352962.1 PREDICTED: uncharacterized protein LOC106706464 [Latimeria chalumnae]